MITQHRPRRKPSGGRYRTLYRKKRIYEMGGLPANTKLGAKNIAAVKTRGGNTKTKTFAIDYVNLTDPKTKKASKAKIKLITDNPANRNFVRRNIITKGTILDTDKGKARVTSRPGQTGTVNAVLISQ